MDSFGSGNSFAMPVDSWAGNAWCASPFTTGSAYQATQIQLFLAGTSSPQGNVKAAIFTDNSGSPGTQLGTASNSIPASTLPSTPGPVQFQGLNATLSAGTTYWIVVQRDNSAGSVTAYGDQLSKPVPKALAASSANGTTWTEITNFQKLRYTVYSSSSGTLASAGGLVASYGLNEGTGTTVKDASANGNNGSITGATWITTGRYGAALSFSGTGAFVSIPNSQSLNMTNAITVEAWVYPTALGGWKPLVYKETGFAYVLMGSSGSSSTPSFGGSFSSANAMGTTALPLNTWSHIAGTYDGTTLRVYVNGVLATSQAQTGTISASTGPLMIGGNNEGEYWAGRIDEVRIYNRALSQSEIQSDLSTPVSVRP